MIGGAPKLAAFAIVIRLLVEGMWPLAAQWQQMLMFLSIASLLIGNLAALMQTNVKRMLAFSTISQMGFVLLGLIAGVVNGSHLGGANAYSSSMFYVITYVLTTLASFGVIILLSRKGFESDELADFAGLNQRSPLYAGIMAACMFSLAGIPPMVGFYAKLSVLQALLVSESPMYIALAVYAVIMSLIGAFYYLRVVKVMYFDAPAAGAPAIEASGEVRAVLTINGLLVLVLGLVPGTLMALCADAVVQMLAT
jgi:NADH-quinone oxidoreductase subunit N